ncbi:hypothetical protein MY4824_003104 [Beauveria thailandica]
MQLGDKQKSAITFDGSPFLDTYSPSTFCSSTPHKPKTPFTKPSPSTRPHLSNASTPRLASFSPASTIILPSFLDGVTALSAGRRKLPRHPHPHATSLRACWTHLFNVQRQFGTFGWLRRDAAQGHGLHLLDSDGLLALRTRLSLDSLLDCT